MHKFTTITLLTSFTILKKLKGKRRLVRLNYFDPPEQSNIDTGTAECQAAELGQDGDENVDEGEEEGQEVAIAQHREQSLVTAAEARLEVEQWHGEVPDHEVTVHETCVDKMSLIWGEFFFFGEISLY